MPRAKRLLSMVDTQQGETSSSPKDIALPILHPLQTHILTATKAIWLLNQSPITPSNTITAAFRFDVPSPALQCRRPSCTNMVLSTNPTGIICPRCGVFSYARYCSSAHLFLDVRRNFLTECKFLNIALAVNEHTIGLLVRPARPFVTESTLPETTMFIKNIIERHRQALYRSVMPGGDYFVFDDIDLIPVPDKQMATASIDCRIFHLNRVRCTGKVCAVITFSDSGKESTETAEIDKIVIECLEFGRAAGTLKSQECTTLCKWILEDLKRQGKLDDRMLERLCVQMGFEFGWRMPAELRRRYTEQGDGNILGG